LTPGQVRLKRVELIQEMLELLCADANLSRPAQRQLQRLTEAITGLQREVRGEG
jgi:uncharacterized tellurite resistance protein B-like protein